MNTIKTTSKSWNCFPIRDRKCDLSCSPHVAMLLHNLNTRNNEQEFETALE